MCHFWVKNVPFALNKKSLVEIINITSICILSPFSMENFKKILKEGIKTYEDGAFLGPNWFIYPKQEPFWEKLLILFSPTYWLLSLCKVVKGSYNGFRVMRMCHFWTQNGPICPNFLFQKNLVPIIYAYLHPKN